MKRIFLILCLFSFFHGYGQDAGRNSMNFYVGFGGSHIVRPALEGGPNYNAGSSFHFGLSYTRFVNQNLGIETALNYLDTEVETTPSPGGTQNSLLPVELVSLRAGLRYSFLRFLYLNGGLLLDFEAENEVIDSQSGIGLGIGIGGEYMFPSGFTIFANPYLNQHALLPFQKEPSHQRLLDAGIRLGVGYRFD